MDPPVSTDIPSAESSRLGVGRRELTTGIRWKNQGFVQNEDGPGEESSLPSSGRRFCVFPQTHREAILPVRFLRGRSSGGGTLSLPIPAFPIDG